MKQKIHKKFIVWFFFLNYKNIKIFFKDVDAENFGHLYFLLIDETSNDNLYWDIVINSLNNLIEIIPNESKIILLTFSKRIAVFNLKSIVPIIHFIDLHSIFFFYFFLNFFFFFLN